ncbi:MAG: hypothetical protein ACTSU6_02565 [Candidatus Njordarchaeales archaeon]
MIIDSLAIIAQIMFVISTIFQAFKSWKVGRADDVSHGLIWMLICGLLIMCVYIVLRLDSNIILLSGHVGQLLFVSVIAKYKYWPRRSCGSGFEDEDKRVSIETSRI